VIDNQHLITWPQGLNRPRDAARVIVSVQYGGNTGHEVLNPYPKGKRPNRDATLRIYA
jgi:hypothetical protein